MIFLDFFLSLTTPPDLGPHSFRSYLSDEGTVYLIVSNFIVFPKVTGMLLVLLIIPLNPTLFHIFSKVALQPI